MDGILTVAFVFFGMLRTKRERAHAMLYACMSRLNHDDND